MSPSDLWTIPVGKLCTVVSGTADRAKKKKKEDGTMFSTPNRNNKPSNSKGSAVTAKETQSKPSQGTS
jgi:hypothetical protein